MTERSPVLILPRHMTSWAELWPIALMLRESRSLRPVVVLATPAMSEKAGLCREHGLDIVDATAEIERAVRAERSWAPRVPAGLEAWFERWPRVGATWPLALMRRAALSRRLRAERRVFARLLETWRPSSVVMPGDRELSPVPPMLRAAADAGVPRVIAATSLPFIEGVAVPRARSRAFRVEPADGAPRANIRAARRFPGQVRQTAYGRLLFSPGWRVEALAQEGMLSDNPWVQGGGLSSHILQHSSEKMSRYQALGVPREKMLMIGDHTLDPLFSAYERRDQVRADLIRSHGLAPDRPLVVMAVPNEAEHDLCDWDTHLRRQRSFWERLASFPANVLLSLHPKSRQENYQSLADAMGFRFSDRRLAEILPAAELFLCSCSTTVHWAKLCAVPTVNLDYLRLGMDYFKEPVGVAEVNTPDEFQQVLPDYLSFTRGAGMAALERHAASVREDTLFDGRAGGPHRGRMKATDLEMSALSDVDPLVASSPHGGSRFQVKFLHVGHHKAGSTFIQNEVIPKIRALRQLPGKRPDGLSNVKLRQAWMNMIQCADLFYDPDEAVEAFAEVEFNCMSNEAFMGFGSLEASNGNHIAQSARRLRRLFGETKILIVLRNQREIVRSYYVDDVEFGYCASFRRWFERRVQHRQLDWFKFAPTIALYRELFGAENVHVALFEELFRRETLERILAEFEIDPAGIDDVDFSKRINQGLSTAGLAASRAVNRFIGTRANWGEGYLYRQWIDRGRPFVERVARPFGDGKPRLDFDGYEASLQELFGDDNHRTAEMLGVDLAAKGYPEAR